MAQRTITIRIDDITEEELGDAGETVSFSLDGNNYEIDLSSENAAALRERFEGYVRAGRKVKTGPVGTATAAAGPKKPSRSDLDAIRSWARDNGHTVSDRGRVAGNIIEAFDAAHS